jgi:hypothetical protein
LDAAEHVLKSREHIRQILREYEAAKTSSLFGNGKSVIGAVDMYKDLGEEGSPVVMMLEMNSATSAVEDNGAKANNSKPKNNKKKGGKKK